MSDWKPPTETPDIKPPAEPPKPTSETLKKSMQGLDQQIESEQNYYEALAHHRSKIQKNGMDSAVVEDVESTTQEMEKTAKRLGELAKKRREMSGLSW